MTKQGRTELVVVGVDGSPASEAALAWAARYAQAIGARLRAVLASQVEQSRYEILDKAIAATCGDEPGREIERKVVYGHPVQVLIEESKEADLLVVGHTGHDGFKGMLLGSVSTHTVTHASCPVTVVRTA